mmetsp:Transcript_56521/g.183709  ORF Transcript_56521/g.183709 Transcript_56521/m.183709 type:complete len:97 (+) Transcript_56521:1547-1837(+)
MGVMRALTPMDTGAATVGPRGDRQCASSAATLTDAIGTGVPCPCPITDEPPLLTLDRPADTTAIQPPSEGAAKGKVGRRIISGDEHRTGEGCRADP